MTRKKDPDEDEARADERERQERVIHTRVSERLESELKERAAALGVSVSNLVRNVLDNAFQLVEDAIADSARIAGSASSGWKAVRGQAVRGPAPRDDSEVIGWQEMVLHVNAVCSQCNAILPRGEQAAIAIVSGGGDRPIVCMRCLQEIRDGADSEPEPEPPADPRRKR